MEILKVGPLGEYKHENHWEETCTDPISHIFVTFNHVKVISIQFVYVKNGALVLSKKYGSKPGLNTQIVRLNHETEFVTGISGELFCDKYINSLTFHTNERKHEVFHQDPESSVPPKRAKIHSGLNDRREFGGFFGSCSYGALESIGLYLRPVLSSVHSIEQENV